MTTQSNPDSSLSSFLEEIYGDSHLRVETDLGGGFVRLKLSEAEKRQAAQDIKCTEDIVLEMLRNARDAKAENIFVAVQRDGETRTLIILDDGMGIPAHMHTLIFEPRVTSKLDTAHMDKWGMHGRGMALYSISHNAQYASVVYSEPGRGSSLKVSTSLSLLPEKVDQSTFPTFELQRSGTFAMRGPKNIIRTVAEFSLEHRHECRVYCGSIAEICATLYFHGMDLTSAKERAFGDGRNQAGVKTRLAYSADPTDFVILAQSLGLEISERTARRIIDHEIAPLYSCVERLEKESFSSTNQVKAGNRAKTNRVACFSKEDLAMLAAKVSEAYSELAEAYYLDSSCEISIRQQGDCLKLTIPVTKSID